MQEQQPVVDRAGRRVVAGERGAAHARHQGRRDVRGHRDDAVAAHEHQRQRGDVLAAVDGEVALARRREPSQELAAAPEIGGGVLDADDAGHLGEPQRGFGREVRDRAAGDVVEHERQINALGDRAEVAIEPFLRRLVVVRHDRQPAVGADVLRVRSELDRLGGGIAADAGHHVNAAAHVLDDGLDQQAVLVDVDGRRLAGRADDHDAGGAALDVPVAQARERVEVERTARLHRRDDRDEASGQHGSGGVQTLDSTPRCAAIAETPAPSQPRASAHGRTWRGPTAAIRCTTAAPPARSMRPAS